jgi:hypothetical protein
MNSRHGSTTSPIKENRTLLWVFAQDLPNNDSSICGGNSLIEGKRRGTSNMRRRDSKRFKRNLGICAHARRLKERRDIGAAVTIAQRPTSGQKRRFDRASAASGLAQLKRLLQVSRASC